MKRYQLIKSRKSLGTMNGYKYDKKVNVEVDKSIVELYIKVTRNQKPTNKSTKAWHKVSCFSLITPNLIGQNMLFIMTTTTPTWKRQRQLFVLLNKQKVMLFRRACELCNPLIVKGLCLKLFMDKLGPKSRVVKSQMKQKVTCWSCKWALNDKLKSSRLWKSFAR
jgi:hypothetical protein